MLLEEVFYFLEGLALVSRASRGERERRVLGIYRRAWLAVGVRVSGV
jgi:hypothetical protein